MRALAASVAALSILLAGVSPAAADRKEPRPTDPPDRPPTQGETVPTAPSAPTANDFFDDQALQEIRLFVHSADWEKLRKEYRENTYYPADLHWRDLIVQNVGIRSRGGGSRSEIKPGLRVDIDRYAGDQQFLGLKSFVLDNLHQDASMVKERVTMRFFQRMGLPAPREAHVRLYVNNELVGIYAIVESIDKDFLARVFGERDGDTENDGYLFEYKWRSEYDFSYLGSDLREYAARYEPNTHKRDPSSKLYGPIEELTRVVNEVSSGDLVRAVSPFLDLGLFIKQVAVENFLAEQDGILGAWGMNNFYLYRFENSVRSQLLVWDRDRTFLVANHPIWHNAERNVLVWRALGIPELREAYRQALLECARIALEPAEPDADGNVDSRGWLEREIAREYDQITRPAEPVPAVRLRRMGQETGDPGKMEVERMLEFARTRSQFVQCEVDHTPRPGGSSGACSAPDTPLSRVAR